MPEDRASRDGLLYLKEEELRSVLRNVPISDVYCVEDTVFARGKFATVRRALHKTTGVQYAAKYIKKRRRNVNMVPEINHEISVLLKCGSNNRVVSLHEVYETNSDMVLILGLAAGGELQSILDGDQCLGEIEARRAMRQILDGLCFLHERNIAHLDLKPQNILLMVEDSCDDIKLCDFGISRLLEPGTEVRTLSGTPDYVAPEVVSYEPISLSTDIWSVGVLAYVLLSGYTPFGADTKEQTSLNISKGIVTFEPEDFVDVSSVALDFIKSILVLNPKQRPSVQELLQHPWINPQSHILPSLSLKTSSDTINVTPKSTPINQRKSLPCPPETLPTNNTRTTFKSDNMNENASTETGVNNNKITSLENINGNNGYDAPNVNGHENSSLDCRLEQATINRPCTLEYLLDTACKVETELVSPNDVLSEVSSEEIEENFYLLKNEKFVSNEDLYPSIPSNPEFNEEKENNVEVSEECHEKTHIITTTFDGLLANQNNTYINKSNEDLLSDSGIVGSVELEIDQSRLNEINNDIEECADKSDTYLNESTQEHHEEISEIKINFGVPTEEDDTVCLCANNIVMPDHEIHPSSPQKTFINTLELNKQIVFSFNYATTSESSARNSLEKSVLINSSEITQTYCHGERLESIEILANNDNDTTEEVEYSSEMNKIFVNTIKIENEDSRL